MSTFRDAVLIADARRTVIGRPQGALAGFEPDTLAALVMRRFMEATAIAAVDRVLLANTMSAGNLARMAALAAGLPASTPGTTLNNQCAGGLTAIRAAAEAVDGGRAGLVFAGGVESVSRAIVPLDGAPAADSSDARPVRHAPGDWAVPALGPAADATAAAHGIDRAAQDACAAESRARHAATRAAGTLHRWLLSAGASADDELASRRIPSPAVIARAPAAFTPGGTVTAANCAPPADGAALALLGSPAALDAAGLAPRARIVAAAEAAGDPAQPALAVLPAIDRTLAAAGLAPSEVDLWEINEAFAVKVVAAMRHYALPRECVNVLGGAIAYGHPFAASGAVLLVHLLAALEARGARRGLIAIAGAGGVAEAMVIERIEPGA